MSLSRENKKQLKNLIKQLVFEEIGAVRANYAWGRTRNGGNVNPPQHWDGTEPDHEMFHHKLQQLEPQINLSSLYKDFLREVELANPEDESSLFALYHNFLRTFGINREEFQSDKDNDKQAAISVYNFFAQMIDNNEKQTELFNQYGR